MMISASPGMQNNSNEKILNDCQLNTEPKKGCRHAPVIDIGDSLK
jgi:hypothetical protein